MMAGALYLQQVHQSDPVCEMYVMQLYLQKAALEEMGIYHFDSWAANFGEVTTASSLIQREADSVLRADLISLRICRSL